MTGHRADCLETGNDQDREEQFRNFCNAGRILFLQKNRLYHEAFKRMGLMGTVVDINGIAARLQNMMYTFMLTGEIDLDKINDLMRDLHNYAVIGSMNVADQNLLGIEWEEEVQILLNNREASYEYNTDISDQELEQRR